MVVIESPNVNGVVQGEGTSDGIDIKYFSKGFSFLYFPLTNPKHVGDFKKDRKA